MGWAGFSPWPYHTCTQSLLLCPQDRPQTVPPMCCSPEHQGDSLTPVSPTGTRANGYQLPGHWTNGPRASGHLSKQAPGHWVPGMGLTGAKVLG